MLQHVARLLICFFFKFLVGRDVLGHLKEVFLEKGVAKACFRLAGTAAEI